MKSHHAGRRRQLAGFLPGSLRRGLRHDGYGFGDGGYSFGGADSVYHGDFYQAIDVYINANWAPTADTYDPSFWIDMTPYHADPFKLRS